MVFQFLLMNILVFHLNHQLLTQNNSFLIQEFLVFLILKHDQLHFNNLQSISKLITTFTAKKHNGQPCAPWPLPYPGYRNPPPSFILCTSHTRCTRLVTSTKWVGNSRAAKVCPMLCSQSVVYSFSYPSVFNCVAFQAQDPEPHTDFFHF